MGMVPVLGSFWTMYADPYATDSDKGFALVSLTVELATLGAGSLVTKGAKLAHAATMMCFAPGTLVVTVNGPVPIEQIQVGDLVLSRSDISGEVAYKRVVQTFETADVSVLELTVTDPEGSIETLQVTAEHPFWVDGRGWIKAHELSEGQTFGSAAGSWLQVKGATWTNVRTTVYNPEVEDFHTYFVGEGGRLGTQLVFWGRGGRKGGSSDVWQSRRRCCRDRAGGTEQGSRRLPCWRTAGRRKL